MYASVDEFAATLRLKPATAAYLSNGNDTLNAFAAQSGWTNNYVVLSNELLANLRSDQGTGLLRRRAAVAGRRRRIAW